MFNILNTPPRLRNYPPMVCKILDKLTTFSHARPAAAQGCSYVLERLGLRDLSAPAIGLPIALPIQAALIHFRKGKD